MMKTPFLLLPLALLALPLAAQDQPAVPVSLTIHADQPGPLINKNLYGQFSEHLGHCIYGGVWVGEDSPIPNTRGIRNDVVAALKEIKVPVVRWPGGCFADEYHWRDGIGPKEQRPKMINTHWGGVVENNHFGTHEFMDFCEQVGCEPYITGNLGSGTVEEMKEWVEYMTSDADSPLANLRRQNGRKEPWKVKYWAVGNEAWGCGGDMRPEYYGDEFRRYNTFLKNYPGNKLYRVACGPSEDDYHWTDVVMSIAGSRMDGLSMHYYTLPTGNWKDKGSATQFDENQWFSTLKRTLRMDEFITKHSAIMDKYDPQKKVGLIVDEWGTWYNVEPGSNPGFLFQQNTLRDAIVAGLNFHIFQRHTDRVVMANIAQLANVLQSMVLTDGPRMTVTPTYWVFDLFKVHQDATSLPVEIESPPYSYGGDSIPAVSASASVKDGVVHLSLVNANPHQGARVTCTLAGHALARVTGRILTASTMQAHNTFEQPDAVHPVDFSGFQAQGSSLTVDLPSKSVVVLEIQ